MRSNTDKLNKFVYKAEMQEIGKGCKLFKVEHVDERKKHAFANCIIKSPTLLHHFVYHFEAFTWCFVHLKPGHKRVELKRILFI